MVDRYNGTAAEVLEGLLSGGGLASQYKKNMSRLRLKGQSFYSGVLAEKGQAAAEAELEEWSTRLRMREFSEGIEPVVRGLLALAQIDKKGEHSSVVEITQKSVYPHRHEFQLPSVLVVVFNRSVSGCGCNVPEDSELFGLRGRLGLKAVTLQAGSSWRLNAPTAELGLVLPIRGCLREDMNDQGYKLATISLSGQTFCTTCSPQLVADGFLKYSLGMEELNQAVGIRESAGGHLDDAVGFPGATDYLAKALPQLGSYLTRLAAALGSDHKH